MKDFEILTVTNSPFLDIVKKMLVSFNKYHPEIKVNVVCVNMDEEEYEKIRSYHDNVNIIKFNKKFKKFGGARELGPSDKDHEQGYCTSCRSWYALDIMEETGKSVFYLDADVHTKGNLNDLFKMFENCDFMIRSKTFKPAFKCNAGMVWMKNNDFNKKIIKEWADETKAMGISWRSNQWTLDNLINKYWYQIKYLDFPEKFNGKTNNPKSVLVHEKGVKLDVRLYNNKSK